MGYVLFYREPQVNVCVPVCGVGVGVVALRGRAIDMEGTHCVYLMRRPSEALP